jgi:HlyD family secretion protein
MSEQRQIFRKESLERLSSPEELDRLLVVIGSRGWMLLITLSLMALAGLAWAIFGRIPETVNGVGVMINPGNVHGVQAAANGQLVDVKIRIGQHVSKGELLAEMSQPEIQQQLDQEEARLLELTAYNKAQEEIEGKRLAKEAESNKAQKEILQEAIEKSEDLLKKVRDRNKSFDEEQRKNLEKTRELTTEYTASLKKRLETIRALHKDKLVPDDTLLQAESSYNDSKLQLANLELKAYEMGVKEIETQQYYLQQTQRISDFQMQIKQLDIKEHATTQEKTQNQANRKLQIEESERKIAQLKLQRDRQTKIYAEDSGHILEVLATRGQLVGAGTRIATIEVDDPQGESKLKCLVYFSVKDGKKIGLKDKAGKNLAIRITPATAERERYGAIEGRVTRISSFPISQEAAEKIVGSAEIARSLTHGEAVIEVEAELDRDPDTFSGYKWTSSKGPDLKFTAGTIATARVTIDERAPITFVLPILKTWVFGAKDDVPQ